MKVPKHIFIIDDDDVFITTARLFIQRTGFDTEVTAYNSAHDALNAIQQTPEAFIGFSNIIFLDLSMPHLDGWDFLEEYALLPDYLTKHIELHIVTTSIDPNDIKKSKSFSCVKSFVSKPITLNWLQELFK